MPATAQQVTKVERATIEIITQHPFFASILLKRVIKTSVNIPTAMVDAYGQITYNPEWFESLTMQEVVFVLCHECMHYMYMHCVRRHNREFSDWNKACDAVINELLVVSGVGTMPAQGIRFKGAHEMSAEQVYDLMRSNTQGNGRVQQPNNGIGKDQGSNDDGWGIGNDLDESVKIDESVAAEIESEVKVEINQAVNAAKQMGKMPAAMEGFVAELLKVKTCWYDRMYAFFTRQVEDDLSWEKLDRRFIARGIKLPWFSGQGLFKVIIINDESGSVSDKEQQEFCGHLNTILDSCTPETLYLLHVDTRVKHVDEYTPDDYPVKMERKACGGTDMTAGIKWAIENHPDADCIVVLTDGYTPFGDDPGIPTFWAITSDIEAPWGESVKLEVSE